MRAPAIACLLLAAAALTWGCGDPFECGARPATDRCSRELASVDECTAEGGCWGRWGIREADSCNCPTTDGGKRCSRSTDCEGACLLEGDNPQSPDGCPAGKQATCSYHRAAAGCRCQLTSEGEIEGLCSE